MNIWDIVVALIVIAALFLAWRVIRKNKNKGCGGISCNGNCASCMYGRAACDNKDDNKNK